MEKMDLNKIVSQTLSSFRTFSEEIANPNFIWRLVLSVAFCVLLTIGVFAYFTYLWATRVEMPMNASATSTRNQFSLADVHNTVSLYERKEAVFNELLSSRPHAPDYRKGSGVQVILPIVSSTTIAVIQPPVGTSTGTSTGTTTPTSPRSPR